MSLTREFLEQQGLEADVITAVLREHGKTVNPLNEQIEQLNTTKAQLETQISERDTQLADLKNSGDDDLKEQITQLQEDNNSLKQQHADELNGVIKSHKIELLANEIGTSDVDWAKDKLAALELKDGELEGAEEAVNALKEKHPALFAAAEPEKPKAIKPWSQGGVSTVRTSYTSKEEIMAIENNQERQRAIADNVELFK